MGRSMWLGKGFGGDMLGGKGFETLRHQGAVRLEFRETPAGRRNVSPEVACKGCVKTVTASGPLPGPGGPGEEWQVGSTVRLLELLVLPQTGRLKAAEIPPLGSGS